jgi:alkylated DNA repair dioxygenase AlkB
MVSTAAPADAGLALASAGSKAAAPKNCLLSMQGLSGMDLFQSSGLEAIPLRDGELYFQKHFPLAADAMARLIAETDWKSEKIRLWGKEYLQPRLTAWHGDKAYTYSGLTLAPLPWTPLLASIRDAVSATCGHPFNSVLLNYYRDGRDSMGMHSDDEAELGPNPVIASLSLGASRTLMLRHKRDKEIFRIELTDGSLLLMAGATQHHWQHGINKDPRLREPRLNLTFRFIV